LEPETAVPDIRQPEKVERAQEERNLLSSCTVAHPSLGAEPIRSAWPGGRR
jgi:hypothetical protein